MWNIQHILVGREHERKYCCRIRILQNVVTPNLPFTFNKVKGYQTNELQSEGRKMYKIAGDFIIVGHIAPLSLTWGTSRVIITLFWNQHWSCRTAAVSRPQTDHLNPDIQLYVTIWISPLMLLPKILLSKRRLL